MPGQGPSRGSRSIQGAASGPQPGPGSDEKPAEHDDVTAASATNDTNDDDAERPELVLPCPAGRAGPRPVTSSLEREGRRRKRRSRGERRRRGLRRRRAPKQMQKRIEDIMTSWPDSDGRRAVSCQGDGKRALPLHKAGMTNIKIYTNNCRGYTSKKESIEKYVIEKLKPDVINLEETMHRNNIKANHKEYFTFGMNRPNGAGGGGIATMVEKCCKQHATKVTENNEHDEYMIVRLELVKPALNIVHVYGRIESRTGAEKVLEGWKQILKELTSIQSKKEAILIIGDLNRAVGDGMAGVVGNRSQVSFGGSLIRELIGSGEYFMINNLSLTTGGPWTRVCPGTGRSSCLDLAIGSINLKPYVKMMTIDSKKMFTPRRAVSKKGDGLEVVFTDHFPSLLELEEDRQKVKPSWNTQKPGAWDRYKEESNRVAEKIEMIIEDEGFEEEEVMEKIDRIQTKLKFTAFGKTKPQTSKAKKAVAEMEGSETDMAKELLKRQSKRIEDEVKSARETANGRVGKIYKMKEIIAGSKKPSQEAQAIKDPSTGEIIVSNSEIKKNYSRILP